MKNTLEIKDRIINALRIRGPCLPVHVAKDINMSILFTSAFLSELIGEEKIKISHMKVGSSSVHYLAGQEQRLEDFSHYLKSREKEAYELLREKKFLKDSEQEPAIRVALRAIKDFAIPFRRGEEIIWRYFTSREEDLSRDPEPKKIEPKVEPKTGSTKVEIFEKVKAIVSDIISEPKPKEIISEKSELKEKEQAKLKKVKKKKADSQKKDDKFFNIIKEFLSKKSIEIIDISGFNKSTLILRVKKGKEDLLLIAYNKRKIEEGDIIFANKKASESNIKYMILSLGEPQKRLKNLIDAIDNLSGIERIE